MCATPARSLVEGSRRAGAVRSLVANQAVADGAPTRWAQSELCICIWLRSAAPGSNPGAPIAERPRVYGAFQRLESPQGSNKVPFCAEAVALRAHRTPRCLVLGAGGAVKRLAPSTLGRWFVAGAGSKPVPATTQDASGTGRGTAPAVVHRIEGSWDLSARRLVGARAKKV